MNIVVVAPTEIPARRANTLQVMKMTQALTILGHNARVVSPRRAARSKKISTSDTNADARSYKDLEWRELAHHYGLQHKFLIDWLPASSMLRSYDYSLRAVTWARQRNADLLYTRLPQAAAIASCLGMPTILEIHDLPQGILGPWLFRLFIKGKGTLKLVVITHALATDLSRMFVLPTPFPSIVIAPDGVDLARYVNLPAALEARIELNEDRNSRLFQLLQPNQFTAGYTGHLYPGRGRALLLNLADRMPDITFLIVGGEPQEVSRLRAKVDVLKLKNVILTGFVPNAELPRYQAACDVLLMPYGRCVAASSGGDISRYLSPMKLFEYLACGRVIVSTDLPVLREVLNSSNSILLPANDIALWEDTLQNLQENPQQREKLATKAHQDAMQYTWETRAEKIFGEFQRQ